MSSPVIEVAVLALAMAGSLVLARWSSLLVIPALLMGGVAVGPHGFGLVADATFLEGANDVGLVLVLFFASLSAHPNALRLGGRIALPLAAYDLLLNFAVAYWIGSVFDWDLPSRLILAGVLTTSSTGTILGILGNEGRLMRREGHVLVAMLWIEDIAFIGFFLFLSAQQNLASMGPSWQLGLGLAVYGLFLGLLYLSRDAVWRIPHKETLIPLITGLGMLGAWLGTLGGLSFGGSAFATGLVLAGRQGAQFIQQDAPWLRTISFGAFFFAFGALTDPFVARDVAPVAGLALVGLLLTELVFLPQVGRLMGLGLGEALILGGSLLARGGKTASFARLASGSAMANQIYGVSAILTILLTPIAPLLVRGVLWLQRGARDHPPALQRADVLSQVTRRVLAPGEYGQRNLVSFWERIALVEWFLLPPLLGLLASLLPYPLRLAPLIAGLLSLPPAYRAALRYFQAVPGAPTTVLRLRQQNLPRLETYLPALLLMPSALTLLLPLAAPQAELVYPILIAATLAFVLALPWIVQPGRSAPFHHVLVRRRPGKWQA